MPISRQQRDAALNLMRYCTVQEIVVFACRNISHIEQAPEGSFRKGYLVPNPRDSLRPYCVQVQESLTREEQVTAFIGEVLHLSLVRLGHEMDDETPRDMQFVERRLEEAAARLSGRYPEETGRVFEQLRRPRT